MGSERKRPLLDGTLLRSPMGRRIVLLFFLCALIPTMLIGALGYRQVQRELEEQGDMALFGAARTAGLGVLRRLDLAEARLSLLASQDGPPDVARSDVFERVAFVEGSRIQMLEDADSAPFTIPQLGEAERAHLDGGMALVVVDSISAPADRILLGLRSTARPGMLVWGVLNAAYLWDEAGPDDLPETVLACVFSEKPTTLHCPSDSRDALRQLVAGEVPSENEPRFEWVDTQGDTHAAMYRTVFLRARYGHSPLIVVATQPLAEILAPLHEFRTGFLEVLLLALVVVLLLSNVQIRRSLEPLEELKTGTQRLSAGELGAQVSVRGSDEFGALASSFNAMSGRIRSQFRELEALHEVDLAVISTLDRDTIIETVITRADVAIAAQSVSLTLLDAPGARTGRTHVIESGEKSSFAARFSDAEIQSILASPSGLTVRDPALVSRIALAGSAALLGGWTILPIFHRGALIALLSLGHSEPALDPEETSRAARLAHKVAVALANTALVEELDALSWGAMTAFARAIDAKSRWTAGHSERVTGLSVEIARVMGLSETDIDIVRRGAILHDIGKIGVSAEILDKPGRLTDAEMAQMRDHPRIGTRILEPIPQYADVLPIVLYHHERLDGSGYPEGLSGNAVPRLARIVAVADVYDALGSDRPYRAGMNREKVLGMIREDSGVGFDPDVVEALFTMLEKQLVRPSRRHPEIEVAV
jgi:putative nucleotidyltransferase with HDIG domain